jgi:LCP family protein required for cell wall assembly
VTVKGVKGGLAGLAEALYGGQQVSTSEATDVLQDRKVPKDAKFTVTGSSGEWHGTPVGVLACGEDLTFAVRDGETWRVVAGRWPSFGIDDVHAGAKQFVLIIGSDAREAEGENISRSRGDTLQVVGVDGSGAAGIVGIPRDSWSSVGKINSALAFDGPAGQTDAIAELTGLPIKYYVLTGFNGFRKFVRALDGVTVTSPHAMPSRKIDKGRVHLDPDKALWFARERKDLPGGDFDRSSNQQRLLVAFALTLKALGPTRFGAMATNLSRVTKTNLPAERALQYAAWAWTIKPSTLARIVATGGFGMRSGQSVVVLGSSAEAVFRDFRDGRLSKR